MRDDFKTYDLIAIYAGRQAGLQKLPTVAQAAKLPEEDRQVLVAKVADSKKAAKLRDKLVMEFEHRLRDPGYNGEQIWDWFKSTYGPIGRSSIFRVRAKLRVHESRIAEISQQAEAFVQLADESGGQKIEKAATRRAAQLYFQLLMQLDAEDLAGVRGDPKKIVAIIDSLAGLRRTGAQTNLLEQRLAETRQNFDRQIAAAQRKAKSRDGKLTPEMIQKVREAVFGSAV